MKKRKSFAFGKDIFLLGLNEYNEPCWLEAPSWDHGWYWGFGYVEVYTNKLKPSKSRDIDSHSHLDGLKLNKSVLNESELKEFNALKDQFYKLKKEAHLLHVGYYGYERKEINKEEAKNINENLLPPIMERMMQLLTP